MAARRPYANLIKILDRFHRLGLYLSCPRLGLTHLQTACPIFSVTGIILVEQVNRHMRRFSLQEYD